MPLFKYLLLIGFAAATALAQQFSHPVMASRDDASHAARVFSPTADTIHLLAVRVQFQPDNDNGTTGNGRFVVSATGDSSLDAPPHDARYFRDHLTFLENYYRKVSRGKIVLRTTLLDSVVSLGSVMSAYSPPKNGPNSSVADLARDTWHVVDSLRLVGDFSRYHCFAVFHAGVGRDIDLVGTLGYDPAPRDIPSLYFGLNGFRQVYGPGYRGIPVQNGSFFITNSLVLPETENRSLPGVGGDVPLQLGINGLLCSSFGNFLGLPDLFDTKTGRSGIGRFGLMDGQAIFSFAGLFPPEPSAWEKYWLGWIQPISVGAGTTTLSLPAIGFGTVDPLRADTVYRVPISASEYFLVENRNRDPQKNGQRITFSLGGAVRQFSFRYDTSGFNAFDVSRAKGVVTDVEDFDWSLPGGLDADGTFFDGGVLIWHIEETVINANIAEDAVNADPNHRGVDVEEADGSQDIGQQYAQFTAGSGSEEGTALDFWFQGNGSPVNKNEFSSTTFPNSNSYSGANSHVAIRNFSLRSPRMTADAMVGDQTVTPLPGFPKLLGSAIYANALTMADLNGDGVPDILTTTSGRTLTQRGIPVQVPFPGRGKLYAWDIAGQPVIPAFAKSGLFAVADRDSAFFNRAPVAVPRGPSVTPLLVASEGFGSTFKDGRLFGYSIADANGDSLADVQFTQTHGWQDMIAVGDSLIATTARYNGYFYRFDGTLLDSVAFPSTSWFPWVGLFARPDAFVLPAGPGGVLLTSRSPQGGTTRPDVSVLPGSYLSSAPGTGTFGKGAGRVNGVAILDPFYRRLHLLDSTLQELPGYPIDLKENFSHDEVAIADFDGDGSADIILFEGQKILAYNAAGALLDRFPITVMTAGVLSSNPIVGDVDGDGVPEIVGATIEGLVFAYRRDGTQAPGFPIQGGTGTSSVGVFAAPTGPSQASIVLVQTGELDGSVSAWKTGSAHLPISADAYPWPQYQHDAQHTGLLPPTGKGTPLADGFFSKGRAYNWPNPVYEGKTFIRYYVKDNASVSIKIFDLAGNLVIQFPGPGVGGLDNEVAWDVSGIQSGIYFAHIQADASGTSGGAVIKIAVVK